MVRVARKLGQPSTFYMEIRESALAGSLATLTMVIISS